MEAHATRKQLTLFPLHANEIIEKIRATFNPIQYKLIPAHVTLCREDEIIALEKVIDNIRLLAFNGPISIKFRPVERFDNGKGVLLPATDQNPSFHTLRNFVLKSIMDSPREHQPHLTLMHPSNATCTDAIFNQIKNYDLPTELIFDSITLIEQTEGGPWQIVQKFPMGHVL